MQNVSCVLTKADDQIRHPVMVEADILKAVGGRVILETIALDRAQEQKVVSRVKAARGEAAVESRRLD